jgi:hypothetical protein
MRTICLFALVGACSNNVNEPFAPSDLSGRDGFVFTQNDLSSSDGPTLSGLDLGSDPNGPTITILTPAKDQEVAYDTLTVTASIVGKNGAFIDGASVQLIIPAKNAAGLLAAPMSLTAMQDVYQGTIDISGIPGDKNQQFTVSATDVNGKIGNASSTYTHDHGPVITFIQPTRSTAHGSLYVQVVVDDQLHPVTMASSVKATVRSGDNIMLAAVSGAVPLRLQGTIDFNTYSPELDGDQLLTVSATNSNNTVGRALKQFTVDNAGPVISFSNPKAGQFIGGVLQIKANIDDISGVNDNSVIAVFGGDLSKAVQLTRVSTAMPIFQGLFDVRQLGTNYVLPALSIRADDQLGLHSEVAEEIVVDNVPPTMTLDSGKVFIGKILPTGLLRCSQPLDPLGGETANDLDKVLQIMTLRARIEDRGNTAPGLLVERVSLVNHDTVFLFGIPAANGALAVDTDGDGVCDDVNPELVPTTDIKASNQAISIQLAPIPPSGTEDLRPSPSPPGLPAACDQIGEPTGVKPAPICPPSGTQLLEAISYAGGEPAIWGIPPIVAGSPTECVGLQFDSLNHMPEGPACFVVIARDNAGNHSVSAPLRVCIDRGNNQCNAWPGTPPGCLGTYDKATMKTNSSMPCTLRPSFPDNQLLIQ